ncbi:hypothetical protein HBE96_20345 [Clostridium sp. P21]|uniref:Uncharacterized protein n=1 Tax=Clostridium muellerianum TaxID=2716538 RepID=A0A7Y0EKV7_9CLOT|nr:hypothetical protein [Clostridium muellerianum]NMM64947.1 hypothetical protein [Clostridium muellerianum]
MNSIYEIYYIGISDFLDRTRSKTTFIITLLIMYISYLFFPQNNSSLYYTLNYSFGKYFYRGIYNSVWLGWVSTIAFISVVTLIGFYFVRNSIKREKELLIGEITASIGTKSWIFIFGKAFGNLLFLLLQMLVVIIITIIMQFVRGESCYLQPIKLLTPFLILAVPACFITAVIAIIFEVIPFLRNSFGNVVYFFAWSGIIIYSIQNRTSTLADVFGMNTAAKIISEQLKLNFKELADIDSFSLGTSGPLHGNIKTFIMDNVNISLNILFQRLFWIFIGILLLFLVSMFFKRTSLIRTKASKNINSIVQEKKYTPFKGTMLSEIFENKTYSNNLSILKSNFKIILTSPNLYWYAILIFCSIGVLFSKGDTLNKFLIPVIWILPIFIWSKLGTVQTDFNMENYLLTYKNYRNTEPLNFTAAGILFTILINTAVIIKFLLLHNFLGILYILMGIFFVNALGIFIGNFARSPTAFEIIYIILWYVGILNGLTSLDFLGLTTRAVMCHIPIIFLVIGTFLIASSMIIKNNRLKCY